MERPSIIAPLLALALAVPAAAQPGGVYVTTNAPADNEVVAFARDVSGGLTEIARVSTGGRGIGGSIDPLGSQGAIRLSEDREHVIAVSAGSHEVSFLRLDDAGVPALVDVLGSRGNVPNSVDESDGTVYVLNSGGVPNVAGFRRKNNGRFRRLGGARHRLESLVTANGRPVQPTQVELSPDGLSLFVTDRATDEIHRVDLVGNRRKPGSARVDPSAGLVPFGFTFARGLYLLVSEVFGSQPPGTTNAGALSSYRVGEGALETITASEPSGQHATCWVAFDGERHAYTTNTSVDTLTAYRVLEDGRVQVRGNGVAHRFPDGARPTDLAVSDGGEYLYVLLPGRRSVAAFRIRGSGALVPLGEVGGLPASVQGLDAF